MGVVCQSMFWISRTVAPARAAMVGTAVLEDWPRDGRERHRDDLRRRRVAAAADLWWQSVLVKVKVSQLPGVGR